MALLFEMQVTQNIETIPLVLILSVTMTTGI
nr:MAG TPA: hypothetical protein [Caudoviricetes sp.]